MVHPGFGAVGLLEKYLGSHFQAKMGRSTDIHLAKMLVEQAKKTNTPLFSASIVGTPGMPEFETAEEYVIWQRTVEETRGMFTGEIANQVFGAGEAERVVPMHVMGVSAELANLRQKFDDENEFRFVPLCLASDSVGSGSFKVDHGGNFATALAEAPEYMKLMLEVTKLAADDPELNNQKMEDFSLNKQFQT
ncbi:hypothetical protein COV53_02380 [Candidatus Gottesmanbacteria bacterium CG11_big_fil_rev_8_21_14_0_20_37_11]|uniref:Uncharacterized protein n=3 Tax=Candidatus Gottesmaniibacteriota TaxID=1752720 RepID=A0A2M7RT24_9BACT|nr:MAG: hypothetical protein AUJ73_03880 [Candidatus Gottesmanbacteria bacterium CG1_02_37_22]PIP32668.1 MAG: hypothetical protein COX23_03270 [Candidatus Gottesmanbacteria bacterium CG23_combo_of_CG06-09_8_20_14_all_37_19]PIR08547.1 MAG: hypothetical protein COV53_02380 [Candidatus Gottesmanbacteria bacterium CG11_big_fil_rev_8_21_14_0_20_37_11]PIZ03199.1 MAG: hypothetical protein COY59_00700 [Candidatus Gottesmanbacteria bacterium CG_4_10_14_0_8_um_filter_37_24]